MEPMGSLLWRLLDFACLAHRSPEVCRQSDEIKRPRTGVIVAARLVRGRKKATSENINSHPHPPRCTRNIELEVIKFA